MGGLRRRSTVKGSAMNRAWFSSVVAGFIAVTSASPVWPLTIESPRPGEQVMPGQTVWLIVQPGPGAEADVRAVQVLAPWASGCENVRPAAPIQCQLTIPDGSDQTPVPTAVDIRVMATFANGMQGSAATQVTIAATEPLMTLRGDPRELPLVFDAVGQEKNLTVFGESAEGARRDLRGRSQGTVYDISNPAVVKVHDDGRVVAQGPGAATITVRSGALFFEVPVIVHSGGKAGP